MKFTSEDLLNAMGLKENDVIQLETGDIFKVVFKPMSISHDGKNYTNHTYELEFKDSTVRMPIMILLNNSYTIIQPKPTLTEDEKVILRNLNKKWKWIVRNEWEDNLVLFTDKPSKCITHKGDGTWGIPMVGEYTEIRQFNHLFQFIKWEDEPYPIKELLGESV